jgi:hypothetical protein
MEHKDPHHRRTNITTRDSLSTRPIYEDLSILNINGDNKTIHESKLRELHKIHSALKKLVDDANNKIKSDNITSRYRNNPFSITNRKIDKTIKCIKDIDNQIENAERYKLNINKQVRSIVDKKTKKTVKNLAQENKLYINAYIIKLRVYKHIAIEHLQYLTNKQNRAPTLVQKTRMNKNPIKSLNDLPTNSRPKYLVTKSIGGKTNNKTRKTRV